MTSMKNHFGPSHFEAWCEVVALQGLASFRDFSYNLAVFKRTKRPFGDYFTSFDFLIDQLCCVGCFWTVEKAPKFMVGYASLASWDFSNSFSI